LVLTVLLLARLGWTVMKRKKSVPVRVAESK
jgi:hypothetical protein